MKSRYLKALSEPELARFQTLQAGNDCALHAISAALGLLCDLRLDPEELAAEINRLWWRGKLFDTRYILWMFVFSVFLPVLANTAGWITAEVGRQPWIVYGLMKTAEGISPTLSQSQLYFSNIMFFVLYLMLFIVFIYVLNNKIQHGPEPVDEIDTKSSLVKLPDKIREIIDSRRKK